MDEVRTCPSGVYVKTHCDLYLGGRGRRASRNPHKLRVWWFSLTAPRCPETKGKCVTNELH